LLPAGFGSVCVKLVLVVTATLTLKEHLASVPGARVAVASHREDDLEAFVSPGESVSVDADLAEPGEFVAKAVSPCGVSGFTHFLDGAEKRRLAGYARMLPMYLVHTSAALVERKDRQMLSMSDDFYSSSFDLVVPEGAGVAQFPGLGYLRVSAPDEGDEITYRQRMRREISIKREMQEIDVASKFRDGCLLVDGGIGNMLDRAALGVQVVGVVKSHQHRYFSAPERVRTILELKPGERTTVFRRERDPLQGREAYSFYLRMFESPTASPLFGLIRVEVPAAEEDLRRVEEICGWLLEERAPLSLPDARYDKMIYPIRLVEQHLKARQPSEAAIRAIVGI
jgi:hypothetical protein